MMVFTPPFLQTPCNVLCLFNVTENDIDVLLLRLLQHHHLFQPSWNFYETHTLLFFAKVVVGFPYFTVLLALLGLVKSNLAQSAEILLR